MLSSTMALAMILFASPDKGLIFWGVDKTEKGEVVSIKIHLKNDTKKPIVLWDPLNYESRASVRLLLRDARGKEADVTPPPAPRGTGVATAITLRPGATMTLPTVEWKPSRPNWAIGKVNLIVIYRNRIAARDAVKGVWRGELRFSPIFVRALNKS